MKQIFKKHRVEDRWLFNRYVYLIVTCICTILLKFMGTGFSGGKWGHRVSRLLPCRLTPMTPTRRSRTGRTTRGLRRPLK